MDRNLPDKAIPYWDKAIEALPDYIPYRYERAICFLMLKQYQEAIVELTPIYKDTSLYDRGWQLMGNCYDLLGDSSKSLPIYREGLQYHPLSGRLHYEMGAASYIDQDLQGAIDWWVKGTKVEPQFATNYYWIVKASAPSDNRIWGALYGELFLLLEPGSPRTKEVSELLYKLWNVGMNLGHPDDPINFCTDDMLAAPSKRGPTAMNFPTAFEFTIALSSQKFIPDTGVIGMISIKQLVETRMTFFKGWESENYFETYPNDLFDFHKKIYKAGYLEQYFWWIYMHGAKQEMSNYYSSHADRYDTFIAWLSSGGTLTFFEPYCVTLGCSDN